MNEAKASQNWPYNREIVALHVISTEKYAFLILLSVLSLSVPVQAQAPERSYKQDDVWSIFTRKRFEARRDSITALPMKLYKPYFAVTPFVGYNPAYGMLIGV